MEHFKNTPQPKNKVLYMVKNKSKGTPYIRSCMWAQIFLELSARNSELADGNTRQLLQKTMPVDVFLEQTHARVGLRYFLNYFLKCDGKI